VLPRAALGMDYARGSLVDGEQTLRITSLQPSPGQALSLQRRKDDSRPAGTAFSDMVTLSRKRAQVPQTMMALMIRLTAAAFVRERLPQQTRARIAEGAEIGPPSVERTARRLETRRHGRTLNSRGIAGVGKPGRLARTSWRS
jgi:hypothetical protein